MNDLVSIIMPSYNTEKYVAESIESVLSQTYSNWELIIVDDNSTDNTDKIIERFLGDKRIKFFRNDNNCGAAYTRNRAMMEAKGKWIAFLDSDDLWLPEKLEKQIHFMTENDYDFSYTVYSEIDLNGKETGITIYGPKKITKKLFFDYCWPGCLTVMYNADKIGLIQIVDIKKNNDYAIWLKVCKRADCYLLKEKLAFYRRGRAGSVSTNSMWTMLAWHYKLFRMSEKQNIIVAHVNTIRNIIFGLYKKIKYVKKEK